jgi:hypothetical protein
MAAHQYKEIDGDQNSYGKNRGKRRRNFDPVSPRDIRKQAIAISGEAASLLPTELMKSRDQEVEE